MLQALILFLCTYVLMILLPNRRWIVALVSAAVFVALGIARYMRLAFTRHSDVGRPEKVLLSDRPLWFIIVGYAIAAIAAVAIGR